MISVSFRHLRVFESVGRLSSFRKASVECCLSQPAATQAIAKLERQVGVVLLDRRSSGAYLNKFGEVAYKRTFRLLSQLEQALIGLGLSGDKAKFALVSSRFTLLQARYLIAAMEHGSIKGAARALGVAPYSLNCAARDLEHSLGLPLYSEVPAGLAPTPAAVEFGRKLKLAMRELDAAVDELEAARGRFGGEIVIGAMLLLGAVAMASTINDFARKYPNANIRVVGGTADDLLRSLRAGDIDFVLGLVRNETSDDLRHISLAKTPFVVVARHGHPLSRKALVTRADLCDYEWVVGTPGSTRRAGFDALFDDHDRPKARLATCSGPIIRLLISENDYLTLMTSYELEQDVEAPVAVLYGPIEPAPIFGLISRENWLPTKLQASFVEQLCTGVSTLLNGDVGARPSHRDAA